jgi:hypothetical protein
MNSVAIVTGASQGIGRSTAIRLIWLHCLTNPGVSVASHDFLSSG